MKDRKLLVITLLFLFAFSVSSFTLAGEENLGRTNPVQIKVTCDDFQFNNHITKSVKLAVHGRLEVILCSNPSTGYQWSDQAQITDHTAIWQTSHTSGSPSSSMLGAPSTEQWTFQALNEGKTTISMEYGRSWTSSSPDDWSLKVNVTVVEEKKEEPKEKSTEEIGEELVRDIFKDMKNLNVSSLEKVISKEFQAIHTSGASDRQEEIETIKGLDLGEYKLSDFKVTRDGDVLVVTYKISAEETLKGEKVSKKPTPRLSVFIKTGSGWKWLAHANPS
ncbi:MAG: protease inhibitor I42 family protein [Candidatus Acetothermia bacterium]